MFSTIYPTLLDQELDVEAMMRLPLTAEEREEESRIENKLNFEGRLKTPEKEHIFTKPKLSFSLEKGHKFVPHESLKTYPCMKPNERPLNHSEMNAPQQRLSPQIQNSKPLTPFSTTEPHSYLFQSKPLSLGCSQQAHFEKTPEVKNNFIPSQAKQTKALTSSHLSKREESQKPSHSSFQSHRWVHHEETKLWWQEWHDPHERGEQQHKEQQENEPQEEGCKTKVEKTKRGKKSPAISSSQSNSKVPKKPHLAPPRMGVFALYYILTKIGILSDGASNYSYKNEITYIDKELTATRHKRLEELKVALEKEQSARRWGIAYKVFSWLIAALGVVTGAAMILTGVGAFGGAMLMVAGIIQMTNQIMEMTGAWNKIAEKLPGDDLDKKRAVISWIQIGIAVLCLALAGTSLVWGGYTQLGEAMQNVIHLIGAVSLMAQGIISIGKGITNGKFYDKLAEVKKYDIKLERLKHQRQDLMEKVEWGMDQLEQLFEDLAQVLGFHNELFQAEQRINQN